MSHKYTDLEKLMRSELNENIKQESWNTPSDELFLNAMDAIEDETKDEKGVIYLSGILLFTLLALLVFTVPQGNKEIETKLDFVENVEPYSDKGATDNYTENLAIIETDQVAESIDKVNLQLTNSSAKIINENKAPIANKNVILAEAKTVENEINNEHGHSLTEVNSVLKEAVDVKGSEFGLGPKRDYVSSEGLSLKDVRLLNEKEEMPLDLGYTKPKHPQSSLAFYATVGASLNSFVLPQYQNEFLQDFSNWQVGSYVDFGLSQKLNDRWVLHYSLAYNRISNHSRFMSGMVYDADNVIQDINGDDVYNCEVIVMSPTTRFKCEMNLDLEQSMEHDEEMRSVTEIEQQYELFRVGVQASFTLAKRNRWSAHVGVGVYGNYISGFIQEMDFKLFHDSYIMTRESMVDTETTDLNRFFLSGGLSLQSTYQWNRQISSGVQLAYSSSVNSLSRVNASYLQDFRLGLTTKYSF